ncbi:MAG: glutaredoxin 3 [Gammaproteobacteria bacterium]|jgi:glutaredoxin 3|uniref:Glutaredoxin n=1 Tax=Rheinheimera soli TaxID=443616 RepID=A0ABU1VZF5_9GAMM|nr:MULTISPECIES: glutaredoxin 3 [Rheinheimera]MBU1618896.1 glutaredoxin 3 [Gammaproteobacteria bacterium]EGM76735.1 Glutaredoxin, GrxC family [Rheinheimera sp. A13L]MBU2057450.1 glutaredoxin 3 [Gammaproteobacteria bacterium]MBU2176822.1 glutaredoxin 3 [Gammaproteobacteria bacterium]MBU2247934.1 glutaredoxin 3 [Gammaproteobacteria bacterium]
MAQVTIYTKAYCPYCVRAKALLGQKGVQFDEIKIDEQPELRPAMIERANGRTTVPQIFIGDTHVGGCDDLFALENAGTLNSMLAA